MSSPEPPHHPSRRDQALQITVGTDGGPVVEVEADSRRGTPRCFSPSHQRSPKQPSTLPNNLTPSGLETKSPSLHRTQHGSNLDARGGTDDATDR